MIGAARKDFVSLAVDEVGAYTNGKQRKQSYWRVRLHLNYIINVNAY